MLSTLLEQFLQAEEGRLFRQLPVNKQFNLSNWAMGMYISVLLCKYYLVLIKHQYLQACSRLSSRHQYGGQLDTVFYLYSSADVPEHFNFLGVLHRIHRTFEYYYNGQKKIFFIYIVMKK